MDTKLRAGEMAGFPEPAASATTLGYEAAYSDWFAERQRRAFRGGTYLGSVAYGNVLRVALTLVYLLVPAAGAAGYSPVGLLPGVMVAIAATVGHAVAMRVAVFWRLRTQLLSFAAANFIAILALALVGLDRAHEDASSLFFVMAVILLGASAGRGADPVSACVAFALPIGYAAAAFGYGAAGRSGAGLAPAFSLLHATRTLQLAAAAVFSLFDTWGVDGERRRHFAAVRAASAEAAELRALLRLMLPVRAGGGGRGGEGGVLRLDLLSALFVVDREQSSAPTYFALRFFLRFRHMLRLSWWMRPAGGRSMATVCCTRSTCRMR